MPQLDISQWPPQLFWLAITFAALYLVVSRMIIPKTGGVIEERKATVASDLKTAEQKKLESEAALKSYEASLADARGKAQASSAAARSAFDAEASAATHKLDAELSTKAQAAEKSISAARAKAMDGLQDVAADVASSIVAELTGSKITKANAATAVAKAAK